MNIYTRRALVICTAQKQSVANTLAFNLTGKAADQNTFVASLVPATRNPPVAPPTHFWASWVCTEADFTRLQNAFGNQQGIWFADGHVTVPDAFLAERGLIRMQGEE